MSIAKEAKKMNREIGERTMNDICVYCKKEISAAMRLFVGDGQYVCDFECLDGWENPVCEDCSSVDAKDINYEQRN